MKTLTLVLLHLLLSMNITFAQNRNLSFLVGRWEAIESRNAGGGFEVEDTTKIFLVFGTDRKPLAAFTADFSKSPAWFDFTIKDTAGNIKLQSLLQVVNDDLIQWQLFDGTRADYFTAAKGEIYFLKRKQ